MYVDDLRFALRLWRKSPGTAAVLLLSLTLGIGANATIFTFVKELFVPAMPVADASGLVMVYSTTMTRSGELSPYQTTSFPNARDYQDRNDVFAGLSIVIDTNVALDVAGAKTSVPAQIVSGNYFAVLGVVPRIGRTLTSDDDTIAVSERPVVVSDALWNAALGADPLVVGRSIRLNDRPFVVVGVAPPDFHDAGALGTSDVWLPISAREGLLTGNLREWFDLRAARVSTMVARLKPGISTTAAQASLSVLGAALAKEFPAENAGRSAMVVPLRHTAVAPSQRAAYERSAALISGLVAVVLLVACANVANLLLTRAMQRRREFGVRMALGASRGTLMRQLLTEGLLLASIAGALAVVFVWWARTALVNAVPLSLRPNLGFAVDYRVLFFTIAVSLLSTMLFGLAPAWRVSRYDAAACLQEIDAPRGPSRRFDLRASVIVAQMALSYAALAIAALFVRSLLKAEAVDPGFEVKREIVFGLNLADRGYDEARAYDVGAELLDRLRALPSVEHASMADSLPLAGGFRRTTFSSAADMSDTSKGRLNTTFSVAPGFFAAAGMRLLDGRDFTEHDDARSEMVAIVNDTAARLLFPGADPLDKRCDFCCRHGTCGSSASSTRPR
jgi:macrolide transport system ATP-binding/permease protein